MAKYRNIKVEYKGIKFDSKHELSTYIKLQALADAGTIHQLELQKSYELIPKIRLENGKMQRACTYKSDFCYYDKNDNYFVVDAKGMKTKEYLIKKKLMKHVHNIEIIEV